MRSKSLPCLLVVLPIVTLVACSGRRVPEAPPMPPSGIQEGMASWYGVEEQGRATASGELMDPEAMTAAHRTLPFGSVVRVTDRNNGQTVEVVINDRGPFVRGRIIDLSFGAARELGMVESGVAPVRIQVVGLDGKLAARRWRVQVGSFKDQRRARELVTLLQAEGYSPVVLSEFREGSQLFFRVWVGAFEQRHDAEGLSRRLVRDGHSGIVVLAAVPAP